jgi:hypothetical protein
MQLESSVFKLSGMEAQTELVILFVLLIVFASLMLLESELKKTLLESAGPTVIWTVRSLLQMHVLPEMLYPLIQVKQ